MCDMEEGTLAAREEDGLKPSVFDFKPDYNLYFKGLVSKDSLAGFGVAICWQDNILFQMKGSIHDSAITVLEAELRALKRGLTEAVSLGMTHISICCDADQYQIFYNLVMGRCAPEQERIALVMDDVKRIRQQLTSSIPVLVTGTQASFAYKLAMETIVSEVSISMPPPPSQKKTICLDLKGGEVSESTEKDGTMRYRFKSGKPFCINLSCNDERLEPTPNPTATWRQCNKCQHIIEPSSKEHNMVVITCRCGYTFCYECGIEWKSGGCSHRSECLLLDVVITILFLLGVIGFVSALLENIKLI